MDVRAAFIAHRQPSEPIEPGGVDAGAAPVALARFPRPVQECLVQRVPNAGVLPVAQPSPAGHARATARPLRQQRPLGARPRDEEDAGQAGAIRHIGRPPLGLGRSGSSRGATMAQGSSLTRGLPSRQSATPIRVLTGALKGETLRLGNTERQREALRPGGMMVAPLRAATRPISVSAEILNILAEMARQTRKSGGFHGFHASRQVPGWTTSTR